MSRDNNLKSTTLPYFTLQEVVNSSGLSEHTLRYYERIGLIEKVDRDSSSSHRRYSAEDVFMIEALACLRKTGMSIEDMRKYLALTKDGRAAADQQLELFEAHREALEQEMARKQEHLRYLEHKVAFWKAVQSGDDARAKELGKVARGIAKGIIKL